MSFLTIIPTIMALFAKAPQFLAMFDAIAALIKSLLPATAQATKPLDVAWLQGVLKAAGFDPGAIDGQFGPVTQAAVKLYQAARGLVADGWPGVATTAKLLAEPK